MIRRDVILVGLVLAAAACGKKEETRSEPKDEPKPPAVDPNAPCPALAITVDGKPLEGLTFGQGVTMVSGSYTTHMVNLYNNDKATCEEAITGRHTVQEGEIYAKAFHGSSPGVGIGAYTHVDGTITLDKATDKVGEPLEICVRVPVVFTPNAGDFSGKKVSIVGKFSGAFCGVNKG